MDAADIDPDKPLARKYELLLLEKFGLKLDSPMSEERILLAFSTLDGLLPHLGVFKEILTVLRGEFARAIYSIDVDFDDEEDEEILKDGIKIPYLVLVKRIFAERDHKANKVQTKLDSVTEELETLKDKLGDSQARIWELEQKCEEHQEQVASLNEEIDKQGTLIEDVKQELMKKEANMETEKEQLHTANQMIGKDLSEAQKDIDNLIEYRDGYDEMDHAFLSKLKQEKVKESLKSAPANPQVRLINDIQMGRSIEKQIKTLQNNFLQTYDDFVESHITSIADKEFLNDEDDPRFSLEQMQIRVIADEMEDQRETFKKIVERMDQEEKMTKHQYTFLESEMTRLEEQKEPVEPKKVSFREGESKAASILDGLEDGDDIGEDPFVPHENIFSKYSCLLFSSQDGKIFYEFPSSTLCKSCYTKTTLCQHRCTDKDQIIKVQPGTTHIKVRRPPVVVKRKLIDPLIAPTPDTILPKSRSSSLLKKVSFVDDKPEDSPGEKIVVERNTQADGIDRMESEVIREISVMPQTGAVNVKSEEFPSEENDVKIRHVSVESTDSKPRSISSVSSGRVTPVFGGSASKDDTFQFLWDDFRKRTNLERTIPGNITQDRCLSVLEQFCSFVVGWTNDNINTNTNFTHVLDKFYVFMADRYQTEEMSYCAAHDFMTAVIENASYNQFVKLCGKFMCNAYDQATMFYFLIMSDFISIIKWANIIDFRVFCMLVYPFMEEDDLDMVQMGYISFSKNKISATLVQEYLLHLILKFREPRFLEYEQRLALIKTEVKGTMNETEFAAGLESILPFAAENVWKYLFNEAIYGINVTSSDKEVETEAISLSRCSQIVAYLDIVQLSPMKDSVLEKMETVKKANKQLMYETVKEVGKTEEMDIFSMRKARKLLVNKEVIRVNSEN